MSIVADLQIHNRVHRARYELQHGLVSKKLLCSLYSRYTPIDHVESFIQQSIILFPRLNCGIASVYLQHLLGKGTIQQGYYGSHNHTFLLLNDSTVIDSTADQFGGPTIYIGPLQYPWRIQQSI